MRTPPHDLNLNKCYSVGGQGGGVFLKNFTIQESVKVITPNNRKQNRELSPLKTKSRRSFWIRHLIFYCSFLGVWGNITPLACINIPDSAPRSRFFAAFSLVELLVVISIMGIMIGLSALAVQGMRAPALQLAAGQVVSGLSLARQIAITKNTRAAFLVATNTGPGLPSEPYRYWSVIYSNKSAGTWTLAKDWQPLPGGVIFLEILTRSIYTRDINNPITTQIGQISNPLNFNSLSYTIVSGNSTIINNGRFGALFYTSAGWLSGSGNNGVAIRVCPGTVVNNNATLTSTNQYYFIESDIYTGRARIRAPESFNNN